jgi:hypothetical protein
MCGLFLLIAGAMIMAATIVIGFLLRRALNKRVK